MGGRPDRKAAGPRRAGDGGREGLVERARAVSALLRGCVSAGRARRSLRRQASAHPPTAFTARTVEERRTASRPNYFFRPGAFRLLLFTAAFLVAGRARSRCGATLDDVMLQPF